MYRTSIRCCLFNHRNIERFKAIQASACLLLALAAGCANKPDEVAGEAVREARLGLGAVLPIDDFKTGKDTLRVETIGSYEQKTQTGTGIVGGTRCAYLGVSTNPLGRPATVEIRDGENGYLAVDTGVGVHQAVLLLYGYDTQCNPVGLDLDLSGLTDFRIEFATITSLGVDYGALDLGTAGAIVVWSDGGSSSAPLSITAETNVKYAPFADFAGDVDWEHVQEIAFEIQSGGSVPGHDYVLRSISAVAQ